jgi:competence protein ComEA
LNEALPRWRTFGSAQGSGSETETQGEDTSPAPSSSERRPIDTAALVATVAGGAAVGVALLIVIGVVLTGTSAGGLAADVGEPLVNVGSDGLPAAIAAAAQLPAGDAGGASAEIVIDVGGAVAQPGLVRLRAGDRVGDAIVAAGGYGPRVDLDEVGRALNLAQPLSDGLKVVVPELGSEPVAWAEAGDDRIDLNTADQAALESLPGIGPVTAAKIIDARAQQPFASVEELRARDIVGDSVFSDIEGLVRASR